MLMPDAPKLKHLKGDLVLDSALRKELNIPNGILCNEVKKWKNCNDLVDDFFHNCQFASAYTYQNFIEDHIESLQKITEIRSNNNKTMELLSDFAQRVKGYLLHPTVDKILSTKFEKTSKKLEQTNEEENLNHEGRLSALLVAQYQSKEIQQSVKEKLKQPLISITHQRHESDSTSGKKPPQENQSQTESENHHHTYGSSEDRIGSITTSAISLENDISNATSAEKREGPEIRNPKRKLQKDENSEEFSKLHFELPEESKRYVINGFDVSRHFHNFQLSLKNHKTKFHAETHVHHILAISSILLLKPERMNPDILNVFGVNNLNLVIDDVKKLLGVDEVGLPMDTVTAVATIIEKLKTKSISRSEAAALLLNMEANLPKNSFKIVKSVVNILTKVPNVPIMETIKENELCTRYLDPLLCGLFDDPDSNIFFRWTNERPNEAKDSDSKLISERPDAVISSLEGVKWANNQGFGEAKCFGESDNNYLTSMDLIRLGMFSKMSINNHLNRGVLTLQAIGTSITFYITVHTHENLYIMYEIAEISAPRCVNDILKYLMDFNKLLYIIDLFQKWCQEQTFSHNNTSKSQYFSFSLANLCAFISPTASRSRQCITKHYYR